jgi:protein-tyrosine-phosphatase
MLKKGDTNMGAKRYSSSRGFPVLCAAGMLLNIAFGQVVKPKVTAVAPTVLFVCEHGAAKSVIAAAFFDKLAKERGLPHRAAFRGVNPDAALNPVAKKGLEQDGVDTRGWKPVPVTQKDVEEAARIITLGCSLPQGIQVSRQLTNWNDIPSPSQNYSDARDQIKRQVRTLVDSLAIEWRAANKKQDNELKPPLPSPVHCNP